MSRNPEAIERQSLMVLHGLHRVQELCTSYSSSCMIRKIPLPTANGIVIPDTLLQEFYDNLAQKEHSNLKHTDLRLSHTSDYWVQLFATSLLSFRVIQVKFLNNDEEAERCIGK